MGLSDGQKRKRCGEWRSEKRREGERLSELREDVPVGRVTMDGTGAKTAGSHVLVSDLD